MRRLRGVGGSGITGGDNRGVGGAGDKGGCEWRLCCATVDCIHSGPNSSNQLAPYHHD